MTAVSVDYFSPGNADQQSHPSFIRKGENYGQSPRSLIFMMASCAGVSPGHSI
jgi:hypothetical protein